MLAKTHSVALVGTEAALVQVEIDIPGGGIPAFRLVGLPAKSVREAEQRVHAALVASGERWPPHRITANLAPGALRKEGTHFDLALAMATLAGDGRLDASALDGWVFVGELALDGAVRSVPGTLAAALACRDTGLRGVVCPAPNAGEATLVRGIEVIPVATARECIEILRGSALPGPVEIVETPPAPDAADLREVRGHCNAKRALSIAAAGGHNLLLIGPPGSGKTMLATRLPGILPRMSWEECIDVTRVHSVAGLLPERVALVEERPFRTPHHNISLAGLVGGGSGVAHPGEVSLSHRGVLFLDELTLYRREVLESLRAPVEEGRVRIARSGGTISYPCRFTLVAAMNPCPCGYLGDGRRSCRCSAHDLQRYRAKISGPLLDRIDIRIEMDRLGKEELLGPSDGEPSASVRKRVEDVRRIQSERYGSTLVTNASATTAQLDGAATLTPEARAMLEQAVDELALSGRGLRRIFRIARTIADFEGREEIAEEHLGEALALRLLDTHEDVAA